MSLLAGGKKLLETLVWKQSLYPWLHRAGFSVLAHAAAWSPSARADHLGFLCMKKHWMGRAEGQQGLERVGMSAGSFLTSGPTFLLWLLCLLHAFLQILNWIWASELARILETSLSHRSQISMS